DARVEQGRGDRAVAQERRCEVLGAGRTQTLAGAGGGAVGVDEDEVDGVVVGVLRRRDRAQAEQVDGAALAAVVAVERVVDRERRQRGIAAAFLVGGVGFRRRADRVDPVGQRIAAAAGVVVEDRDAGV